MTQLDDLIDRLRAKVERARDAIDSLPPDVRAGVDQHVSDDEQAIRALEKMREALDDLIMAAELPGDHCELEPAIDRARKALRGAA